MKFTADFSKTSAEYTGQGPAGIKAMISLLKTRDDDFSPDVFFQGEYTGLEHRGRFSGASSQIEKVFPTGEQAQRWANELQDQIKKDLDLYRRGMVPAKIEADL